MKKFVAILMICACLLTTASAEYYFRFGKVIDFEWDCDCMSVDDGSDIWDCYGVIEDYYYGDFVVMIMDDKGTPSNPYDDSIEYFAHTDMEEALYILENYPCADFQLFEYFM